GNHREALAGPDIEAGLPGGLQKELSASLETRHPLRLAPHHLDGGERGRGERRRHADAVDEAWCRVLEILDEVRAAGDVAPAAGQRLAQRSHPEVDVAGIDAALLR